MKSFFIISLMFPNWDACWDFWHEHLRETGVEVVETCEEYLSPEGFSRYAPETSIRPKERP